MKKILIVDDSLFMRSVLKDVLSSKVGKYNIVEATSSTSALKLFRKENPDLILLDIIMPESEEAGLEVLRGVMEAKPEAKIVMISAVGQELVMEECKKLGAKDYITKPFDEMHVIKTVEKYLSE